MKIHEIKGYIQSIYLVEYDHGLLLLDGAGKSDIDLILSYIHNHLKRPLSDLKTIVVTHMHPDHAGAAESLKKITGAKIAAPTKVNSWYKGLGGLTTYFIDLFLTQYVGKKMGKPRRKVFFKRTLSIDYELGDGFEIPDFEDWSSLSRPGHTDCDLSVFHRSSGTIYVADNIISTRKGFITPYPVNYPDIFKESLASYKSSEIKTFLLAHHGEKRLSHGEIDELISKVNMKPVNHSQIIMRLIKNFRKHNYF